MSKRRQRIEPVLGRSLDDPDRQPTERPAFAPERPVPPSPWARLVMLSVVLACVIFIADRALVHYKEYRYAREVGTLLQSFQDEADNSRRRAEVQHQNQRRMRAASNQGKWLARNCEDWRRSHQQQPLPTSEAEMARHCRIYRQYLDTGRVSQ